MASRLISVLLYTSLFAKGQVAQAQTSKFIPMRLKTFRSDEAGRIPLIEVGVGSPPQPVMAILDTGSSDFIVPKTGSKLCQKPTQQCADSPFVAGSFDPDKDSQVTYLNIALNTDFANGENFQGQRVQSTLTFGNQSVPDALFGVEDDGFLPEGNPLFPVMGVGPIGNEATDQLYQNVPAHLKDVGAVTDNLYGIYINDLRAPEGSMVFGGIDTAKFQGKLQEAPILADDDGVKRAFVIEFSSMTLVRGNSSAAGGNANLARRHENSSSSSSRGDVDLTPRGGFSPSLIDTGNPELDVPIGALRTLAMAMGLTVDEELGEISNVPCDLGSGGESISFGFNNNQVKVSTPLAAMVDRDSEGTCFLPIFASDDVSLGTPFMQGAYIVYDLDQKRLLMAQSNINTTASDVQELSAGL